MVTYLKVGLQVRTYSDYLRATWEVEKKDLMELSRGPRTQLTILPNHGLSVFFALQKLKGNQPTPKVPAVHLVHLEEEDARSDGSDDPSRIKGVTEELMVYWQGPVKDA